MPIRDLLLRATVFALAFLSFACLLGTFYGFWSMRAFGALWLAVVAAALPVVMRLVQRGADHVLRPPGTAAAEARGVAAATIGRALRALAIIGAAYLLVDAFGLDVDALAASDTMGMRLVRGAVHALVIVLVADVAWMVCAALIDQKLASVRTSTSPENEHRDGRLRTLLPIVRGTLAVLLIVMTVLMVLSALGIQVGPLLAGAGVLGLAVGFGAQTLVKDVISGLFLIAEDQVRIGDAARINGIDGSVEEINLRTIVLRDLEGTLHYIANGEIRTLGNKSKDFSYYVIDIAAGYDDNTDRMIEVVRDTAREFMQDPEYAASILEPLEILGVDAFKPTEVTLRFRIKTLPLKQWEIGRELRRRIKKAFDANGIVVPGPQMTVTLKK